MSRCRLRTTALLLVLALFAIPSAQASMVRKMDLPEVCDRADRIFRGTVLSAQDGTLEVGGGELPTVTYRIKVTEAFQGDFLAKGDDQYAEITMLRKPKTVTTGDVRLFSVLPDLPQLAVGGDYLLMTSTPSSIGLSTTIGLGQGCYLISGQGKAEMATNALGESMTYAAIATMIRSATP